MDHKRKKKKIGKRAVISMVVVAFIISNTIFFYAGNISAGSGLILKNVNDIVKSDLSQMNDTKKYDLLFKVRKALLGKYDGQIDDNQLLESAIKGMTQSLNDPYTVFMNGSEYKSFIEQSEGHFVGIGVQIAVKDNKVTVISPIKGSPAEKAGVKSGDIIVKVDGKDITEPDADKVTSMIKGEQGKSVKLSLLRDSKNVDISIVRDVIKVESVKGEMIDNSIGYVQISAFDEDVSKDFKESIKDLKSKGMKGMVLDLRGNPGGFLNEAVNVASEFIPKDKVVTYTIDKYNNKEESKSVGGEAQGMPLVILINGGSASASEVVTGALRDYGVATTIGTTSFGKGIVQQLLQFGENKGGLKVTTSKYYTPNGENIHKIGIKPQIEVELPKEEASKQYDRNQDEQFKKALEVVKGKLK